MTITRDPETAATELAGKLSAKSRHVCTLFGAGISRAAGLPDLKGLQDAVKVSPHLTPAQQILLAELLETRNLEEILSYLRRLIAILGDGEMLGHFDAKSAAALQSAITHAIIPALDHSAANIAPIRSFAVWASGGYYVSPIEVFTINYDLLFEVAFEAVRVPYFDGFVGSLCGQFYSDLVDGNDRDLGYALPPNFVRLWKLHGSVNWQERLDGARREIVRLGTPVSSGSPAAIYPSDEKYDQSRRVPFVVLMDRFRRALSTPETLVLVAGYSFGDQHLNEMLFDAARSHPRSETVVFCRNTIPAVLSDVAAATRNICVLSRTEGIIGGQRTTWARADEIPGVWSGGSFLLGDFGHLAMFLATRSRIGDASA